MGDGLVVLMPFQELWESCHRIKPYQTGHF